MYLKADAPNSMETFSIYPQTLKLRGIFLFFFFTPQFHTLFIPLHDSEFQLRWKIAPKSANLSQTPASKNIH